MPKETKATFKSRLSQALAAAVVPVNVFSHFTGISEVEFHSDTSINKYHSPKVREEILRTYKASIKTEGLSSPLKALRSSIESNIKSLEQKNTGFEALKEKLQTLIDQRTDVDINNRRLRLITTIESQIRKPKAASPDLTSFSAKLDTLDRLLTQDGRNDPRAIVAYIKDQYRLMIQQLDNDQKEAMKEIDDKIKEITKVKILSQTDISKLKQDLEKNLNESYEKARKDLKTTIENGIPAEKEGGKSTPSLLSQFDKAVDQAESEVVNLHLYSTATDSKAVEPTKLSAQPGSGIDPEKYLNTTFDDYVKREPKRTTWTQYFKFLMNTRSELYTPSGLKLNHQGNGAVSITIPSMSYSLYHMYNDNQLGSDLLFMANEIRAQGHDTISFNINIKDPKLRQKIMEESFYAAKLAGFADDKISFTVSFPEDKEGKQSIDNKKATEIMGRLGEAPQRAQLKLSSWEAEQKEIDQRTNSVLRSAVDKLDEDIDAIINQKSTLKLSAS